MDDALLVRFLEGLGGLLRDGDRFVGRHGAALQALGEVFSVDVVRSSEAASVRSRAFS